MKWIAAAVKTERRRLERARRSFLKKPTDERLHEVRTTGRRLRSLLEDVADIVDDPKLLRRVRRAAAVTDAAREASVILALLERSAGGVEREIASPLREELRRRVVLATRRARRSLRELDFA